MKCAMLALLCGMLTYGTPATQPAGSYLCQPAYSLDDMLRIPAEPYQVRPGDIMLTADQNLMWSVLYRVALTSRPYHSGIVVARSDGRLAVLEAGAHDTHRCDLLDVGPNLRSYEEHGLVWIRKRCVPLTAAESARLTAFAAAQVGKRFALCRMACQVTPLRSRGPVRTWLVGGPHGNRSSYFCSELVMEACVAAGLVDGATTRPAATFPRDLFFDRSLNPFVNKHLKLRAGWHPPARWLSQPREMNSAPNALSTRE